MNITTVRQQYYYWKNVSQSIRNACLCRPRVSRNRIKYKIIAFYHNIRVCRVAGIALWFLFHFSSRSANGWKRAAFRTEIRQGLVDEISSGLGRYAADTIILLYCLSRVTNECALCSLHPTTECQHFFFWFCFARFHSRRHRNCV